MKWVGTDHVLFNLHVCIYTYTRIRALYMYAQLEHCLHTKKSFLLELQDLLPALPAAPIYACYITWMLAN